MPNYWVFITMVLRGFPYRIFPYKQSSSWGTHIHGNVHTRLQPQPRPSSNLGIEASECGVNLLRSRERGMVMC